MKSQTIWETRGGYDANFIARWYDIKKYQEIQITFQSIKPGVRERTVGRRAKNATKLMKHLNNSYECASHYLNAIPADLLPFLIDQAN